MAPFIFFRFFESNFGASINWQKHFVHLKFMVFEIFQNFTINRNTYQGFINLVGLAYCK